MTSENNIDRVDITFFGAPSNFAFSKIIEDPAQCGMFGIKK